MASPNINGASKQQIKNLKEAQQLGKALNLEYENIADIQRMILSNQISTKQQLLEQLRLAREAQDIVEDDIRLEQEKERRIKEQNKRIQDQIDHIKKLNDLRKNAIKIDSEIADIAKSINKLAETMFSNTSDNYDQQKKILQAKKAQVLEERRSGSLTSDAARNLMGQLTAQELQLEALQQIQGQYQSQFDKLTALGGLLSKNFGMVGDAVQSGINKGMSAFTKSLADGNDKTVAMKDAMKAFGGEMAASIAKSLSVIGIIKILYDTLKSITDEANQLATETGLTFGQARKLADESRLVAASMDLQLATAKDIVDVQKESIAAFGTSAMLSNEQAANVAELGKSFGYGAAQAGKVNNAFMSMGVSADEAYTAQQSLAAEALKAGVNVGAVTKDIAENSKLMAKYFGGNVGALKNAAIEAAKMGMSLATMGKVSDKLLDIQSSISAQFEFQALSGRQLDLDKARQLALEGNIADASKEVLSAVGSISEFNQLSVLEKKKLAEATGMEVEELQKSLVIQGKLGDLTDDQKAAMAGLNLSAAELNDKSPEQLQALLAQQQTLNASNKQLDDFKNTMKTALVPLAEALGTIFAALAPAFKAIGFVIQAAFFPITAAMDGLQQMYNLITGAKSDLGFWNTTFAALAITIGVIKTAQMLTAGYMAAQATYATIKATMEQKTVGALIKQGFQMVKNLGTAIAEAVAKITGMSAATFGVAAGIALAAGAAAYTFLNSKDTGDLAMPADSDGGPIVTNPREGTIFRGTKNDEVAMGPGVIDMAQQSGGTTVVQQSAPDDSGVVAMLSEKLDMLAQKLTQPPQVVIGTQAIKEISNLSAADNTFRQNYNGT
jgi:hypothetical protein